MNLSVSCLVTAKKIAKNAIKKQKNATMSCYLQSKTRKHTMDIQQRYIHVVLFLAVLETLFFFLL